MRLIGNILPGLPCSTLSACCWYSDPPVTGTNTQYGLFFYQLNSFLPCGKTFSYIFCSADESTDVPVKLAARPAIDFLKSSFSFVTTRNPIVKMIMNKATAEPINHFFLLAGEKI